MGFIDRIFRKRSPIRRPVHIERGPGATMIMIADDSHLVFSSSDITLGEMEFLVEAVNGWTPTEHDLDGMRCRLEAEAKRVESLILDTPTGLKRSRLTEANIHTWAAVRALRDVGDMK